MPDNASKGAQSVNMAAGDGSRFRDSDGYTGERLDNADAGFLSTSVPERSPVTSAQSFTPRSLLVGLIIGALITFSNTYFGLQTGWISTMAMPSALIGFSVFKVLSKHLSYPFTPIENVLIQTVAGAVGTMPLGCGFVGVIPALEFLIRDGEDGPSGDGGVGEGGPLKLSFWKLVIWSLGVCLFGVVFAVPLRKEVIVREKLKFPSGTASALMLRVLHGSGQSDEKGKGRLSDNMGVGRDEEEEAPILSRVSEESGILLRKPTLEEESSDQKDWRSKMRLLVGAFAVSGIYTLFSYFVPQVRDIPIFGLSLAQNWLWTLNPSPAYVGQGIIMGPSTCMHMLFGAVLGWGILSPFAKARGWAPGPVDSWDDGSKAWIVWVSLAIMLADSVVSLGWLVLKPAVKNAPKLKAKLVSSRLWRRVSPQGSGESHRHDYISYSALSPISEESSIPSHHPALLAGRRAEATDEEDAPPSQLISTRTVIILLPLTLILNVVCMHFVFGDVMSPLLSSLATLLAVLLSIMGVRALGETDLNPVSGISKLTQLLFSLATPASHFSRRTALVTNLLAGAVSESGALQAGDMMQDLKTGHLLGASPKAQFYGQMIGSLVGAVLSTAVYKMYVNVYEVPGPMFQTPTAYVWIFTARLVTGQGLPPMAWEAASIAGLVFVVITILRMVGTSSIANGGKRDATAWWRSYIPGGIAVAVGIFNVPSFTLARAIGGLISWWWSRKHAKAQDLEPPTQLANEGQPQGADTRNPAAGPTPGQTIKDTDAASSTVVVLASGLILGEGIISIVNLLLASGGVPHL
ncbi:OPT oligopeptide transporter protein-domain-containing protein [Aspergillus pseudotamarii]|uniref:OPT oligopeptide transporter protein-domain-containing protein n=1 Tax=Aspergillus pseudotamarii TaxID=132259 RepID=A0A5N6TAC1_ASPPS|nr:OPT oligopeptide transporter protein-domain-containing protein [Aspergillus pseudotamarii]KAE8143324.1 OPT oligopeptide transporter protein-domain-containing protein [Aspergillus pseudotamarii]